MRSDPTLFDPPARVPRQQVRESASDRRWRLAAEHDAQYLDRQLVPIYTSWGEIFVSTPPVGQTVYPLHRFPEDHREWIILEALDDDPPQRWRTTELFMVERRSWYEWHWHRGIDPLHPERRPSLPEWMRWAVIKRDGYVCGLCGGGVDPEDVHIDHITPWSRGGKHEVNNLQVAHSLCNLRKGNRV